MPSSPTSIALLVPGLTLWQHPRFFGYFPANSSYASVLGDLLSTGLGVLGLNWQASPALTELEAVVCDWMRGMVGLSDAWSGVIQDTASTANLLALLCARERATNFSLARGGLQGEPKPLVVYASSQSHSSVEKAALLAGFGRDNVRMVPHDDAFAMRPEALEERRSRRSRGPSPLRGRGHHGHDRLHRARSHCRSRRGRRAAAPVVSRRCRHGWIGHDPAGMPVDVGGDRRADSLVLNPHKWLGTAFDCSLYYVRDPEHLVRVMSTSPSYLRTAADGRVRNYRDWGIALGRRFRALKLWCLIRAEGVSGLQARLRRDLDNARWLAERAAATPPWRVVAPVRPADVCLRHQPPGLTGDGAR